jgi:hypothetical protein
MKLHCRRYSQPLFSNPLYSFRREHEIFIGDGVLGAQPLFHLSPYASRDAVTLLNSVAGDAENFLGKTHLCLGLSGITFVQRSYG